MTGFALPYLGLEEVTGNKVGVARSLAAEFIGTAVLVQNRTEVARVALLLHSDILSICLCWQFQKLDYVESDPHISSMSTNFCRTPKAK